jgi:hypothetical protein
MLLDEKDKETRPPVQEKLLLSAGVNAIHSVLKFGKIRVGCRHWRNFHPFIALR